MIEEHTGPGKGKDLYGGQLDVCARVMALAGANHWQERSAKGLSDGLLTAAEVENLDLLGTELVILSACDTAGKARQASNSATTVLMTANVRVVARCRRREAPQRKRRSPTRC